MPSLANKSQSIRRLCLRILISCAGAAAASVYVLLIAAWITAAVHVVLYVREAPPLDPARVKMFETTYIYDAADNKLMQLHEAQNRVYVDLDQIPLHVQQAFIAFEDRRFFEHGGFDLEGSLRALMANLHHREITQGASTITQQLARNIYLPLETSFKRKIQEIWLAIQMEQRYSKQEILEMYLNLIYFGNGAYGVEAAAQLYFNKSISEVTLAEAAMLAGLISSPNHFNPHYSSAAALRQCRKVLKVMFELGYITPAQYRFTHRYACTPAPPPEPEYPHPYYLDYIIHHALPDILLSLPHIHSREEAYKAIYTGGLRVYTTLQTPLQEVVEQVLDSDALYPQTLYIDLEKLNRAIRDGEFSPDRVESFLDPENGIPQPQSALVLADPQSGAVLALGGGRNYRKGGNELLRYLSLRQPGSAIKPLVVYAPAFEEGIISGAASLLVDAPLTVNGWRPRNYDGSFRGKVTVRQALAFSLNLPAVRLFQELTPPVGTGYAEDMGISTFTPVDTDILSTAIGGVTYGVSAYDMAQAYCVLANAGVKNDLFVIRRIENRAGEIIYEHEGAPKRILSPQTAFLVNHILLDVVQYSTATGLRSNRPIAAKTGTTDQAKDIYLVAYTPNLVAVFWIGYDEPELGGIPRGWHYAAAFVREVLNEAFKELPVMEFEPPEGIGRYRVCKESGDLANEYCAEAKTAISDYFFDSRAPHRVCSVHTRPLKEDDGGDDD